MMILSFIFRGLLELASAQQAYYHPYSNSMTQLHAYKNLNTQFPKNYTESRQRFLESAKTFKQTHPTSTQVYSAPLPDDRDLSIDGIYIQGEQSTKLFILTSGIHGAEAFAGSALQDLFFKYLQSLESLPYSVFIAHSLNPHGFKHFRRGTPSNVDLNRNHASVQEFSSVNTAYETLASLVSPTSPASAGLVPQLGFYIELIIKYLANGKRLILNSLSGQFKDSRGLFYGGKSEQPETLIVQKWMTQLVNNSTHVVHIDLHTGFGKKGQLHFYGSDEFTSPQQLGYLKRVFPNAPIDTGKNADFYHTRGDFIDWTWKNHPQKIVVPMVFEFGTMDSESIMGGLNSLWAMTLENQGHHYGYATKQDQKKIREQFESLFNPQNYEWQSDAIHQGISSLIEAYINMKNFKSE